MIQNKIFSLLGIATKSGNVVSGEFMTEKVIKSGKAFLVIVGTDASENTKKMFQNSCSFYKIPVYFYGSKEELGHSMGKQMRASLAITDSGFAKALITHLNSQQATGSE